ncbi:MAG: DedA family protein [Vampirovibrionales bacterium]|nr:DedA family protein [Vampirovibrionales bacterium]
MLEFLTQSMHVILDVLRAFVQGTIDQFGYVGIALLMAIESANVPLPSELILPYAGLLVQQGKLNFHGAALAGAIGCVLGSLPSYWLGWVGGRAFLNQYGKFLLLTQHDLDVSEKWVAKYGDWAFFLCRMLPVVRTFISLPAGILKAHFWTFTLLTFIGSWVWSYALVYVGIKVGDNLETFKHYWHQFDAAIAIVLFILGGLYVYKHVKHLRKGNHPA